MALGALLALAWGVVLPPLQGPDESAHVAAVTRLVEHGHPVGGAGGLPREIRVLAAEGNLGPLIGNLAARPAWNRDDRRRIDRALDALGSRRADAVQSSDGPPTQGTARNPPLYTAWESIPYAVARGMPLLDRLTLMRLWNIPLLLVTIAACWLLAAEALPGVALAPLLAGSVAALQPELVFLAGGVNPDSALIALTSVFCLLAVRLLRRGITPRRAVWMCIVVAATMATHPRGVALVPCAALAIALALPWRAYTTARRWRVGATLLGSVTVVGAAAAAVAQAIGLTLTGTSLHSDASFSVRGFVSYLWQFYLPRLPFIGTRSDGHYGLRQVGIDTAWGTFASLEVRFPDWVFDVIEVVLALILVAALVRLVRGGQSGRGIRVAVLLAAVAVATMAALHVAAYRLLRIDPTDPIIVGRQVLVLIAPLAVLVAFAVTGLGRRLSAPVSALLIGGLVALNLAGLGLAAVRFYA